MRIGSVPDIHATLRSQIRPVLMVFTDSEVKASIKVPGKFIAQLRIGAGQLSAVF